MYNLICLRDNGLEHSVHKYRFTKVICDIRIDNLTDLIKFTH